MGESIIEVRNLGKSYLLSHEKQRGYVSLRDIVAQRTKAIFSGLGKPFSRKSNQDGRDFEEFWALKDVSFNINAGDAVGIIGNNGAGKSTLLKILSRITEPTKGKVILNGRVASLLEVGTGFHPELSGRENIYLNGAILGMTRREIKSKFDEIVDFSGVEKFLDTPVKRYSSGMYVRLAFAVAAHLEPEILVVDEVLAVGDAEFQKKCMGKMDDVSKKQGKTVLFVSHNMTAIEQLCSSAILLQNGSVALQGKTREVSDFYQSVFQESASIYKRSKTKTDLCFQEVSITDKAGQLSGSFSFQEDVLINFIVHSAIRTSKVLITLSVLNLNGVRIFLTEQEYQFVEGDFEFSVLVPASKLVPGQFSLYLAIHIPNIHAYEELDRVCRFTINETGSPFLRYGGKWDSGLVIVDCPWSLPAH